MSNILSVTGFKCFDSTTQFEIKDVTVLTGSNGTGKSSVIQSLLLARLAIEKNLKQNNVLNFINNDWKGMKVPLDDGYELKLGTVNDIFYQTFQGEQLEISIGSDKFGVALPDGNGDDVCVDVRALDLGSYATEIPFWRKKEFYYLHTERYGPRHLLESSFTDFTHCGYKGEFTAKVLLQYPISEKIPKERHLVESVRDTLSLQVDDWLEYICPGTTVGIQPLGSMHAQIRAGNNSVSKSILATNIGFGISYVLPIIVNGLIAEKGAMLIVENPEAHLHPKGQSNIGFFLAKIAAAGVRVIIETHSDHVVNGIRRAALSVSNLNPHNIGIYFFNGVQQTHERIIPIQIKPNGDLTRSPADFFDQSRQDLLEILKLSKR